MDGSPPSVYSNYMALELLMLLKLLDLITLLPAETRDDLRPYILEFLELLSA